MSQVPDILKKILDYKVEEVAAKSAKISLRELSRRAADSPPPRGFIEAIDTRLQLQQPAVIAEIKKASPSKGVLREHFSPAEIAESYEHAGAACLSVLTDRPFFQGALKDLQRARKASTLPIIRKDFMIDPYQVYESRVVGADCILLIVAALGDAQLHDLAGLAKHLKMDVLVEVHDREELERALLLNTRMIGINNRSLRTFKTDLQTSIDLGKDIPRRHIIVSESGISDPRHISLLREQADIHTFLIGESLMTSPEPGEALINLLSE
ncbi:indole-3-glycerol phosphate synthase TrpC [Candidatus Albibeggiatoa sp. nov. BB20]|uniref:indole-3-glycerol phosphate synthase TrpC n=1 Tax=Candidatus Albibeggiatoa sp. nov. BB20 TaxID=3162723 RepID=UPI00336596CC